jgi:mediator of RNA polymerase II transcription subunit 18, fungi type
MHFFRENTEFLMTRHYPLPKNLNDPSKPLSNLPAWENLTTVDSARRWILTVKVHVLEDNKPDEIKKQQDILMSVRKELEGVIDFKEFDRRCRDTRIAVRVSNTPVPLPHKQTINSG